MQLIFKYITQVEEQHKEIHISHLSPQACLYVYCIILVVLP